MNATAAARPMRNPRKANVVVGPHLKPANSVTATAITVWTMIAT